MSVQQLDALFDKAAWLYPSRSSNLWMVIHEMLRNNEYRTGAEFKRAVIDTCLGARRDRAQGIFRVLIFDRERDGDDELSLSLYGRTEKPVSSMKGTLELSDQSNDVIASIEIKIDTPFKDTVSVKGRWPMSQRAWRIIDDQSSWPKVKFVVSHIIYADGSEEIFNRQP